MLCKIVCEKRSLDESFAEEIDEKMRHTFEKVCNLFVEKSYQTSANFFSPNQFSK